jgi:hypothetical protein
MLEKDFAWSRPRHFARVAVCLPVTVCFPRHDVRHETTTLDCSGGGIGIAWRGPLPRGMSVELEISLPSRRVVRTDARVAFSRAQATILGSHRIGLEFVKMPEAERTAILRLVHARCCRGRTG